MMRVHRLRSGLALAFASGLIALVVSSGTAFCDRDSTYRGRPLIVVLQQLRERGINLVFSSAVVREDLMVTVEPTATAPRALLDEILTPLGLAARDGPHGSILIVVAPQTPSEGRLRGRVLAAGRHMPIVGASVRVLGTSTQTTTRPDGTFEIPRIPAGTYDVVVNALGFVDATLSGLRVQPGKSAQLAVTLERQPNYVERMVVTPSNHSLVREGQSSDLSVNNEDVVLVPASGGDVSRILESLPGMAAPDNSAAFNARGSEARDVALTLDGLELYEPFHLPSFQSPFSFIDSGIIDAIDVYGGGFTSELGDRQGGFVEISTAVPEETHRTKIGIGTMNSSVSYGARMASGSLLVAASAWYPEAFRHTIEVGRDGPNPQFGNAYFKFSFNVSPRVIVSAHGLFAYDRLEFDGTGSRERAEATNASRYLWLRVLNSWSSSFSSETVLSGGRLARAREGVSGPENSAITVSDNRTVAFFGLKHDLTWEMSSSHLLKAGVEIRRLGAEYRYSTSVGEVAGSTTSIRLDPAGTSMGAYVAYRAGISSNFATEVGVRWDRETYTNDDQLSPRFNAVWHMTDRSELRLGMGRFFQSQRIYELHVEDGETAFLPAELSRQAELTFQHRFRKGLEFRVDAYYHELSQLQPRHENLFRPIELFPETETDRVLVPATRARLRGVELLLRGDHGRPFQWWMSYALSSAEDVIDGKGVPRSWDQTHAWKGLVGYHWGERWSVSLSGAVHTGWPTTPVSAELTTLPGGSTQINSMVGSRNSERFPLYARLDVKASRSFLLPRSRLRLEVQIDNLTDRDNACCVDSFAFEPRADGTVHVRRNLGYWLGITPSSSLHWEF